MMDRVRPSRKRRPPCAAKKQRAGDGRGCVAGRAGGAGRAAPRGRAERAAAGGRAGAARRAGGALPWGARSAAALAAGGGGVALPARGGARAALFLRGGPAAHLVGSDGRGELHAVAAVHTQAARVVQPAEARGGGTRRGAGRWRGARGRPAAGLAAGAGCGPAGAAASGQACCSNGARRLKLRRAGEEQLMAGRAGAHQGTRNVTCRSGSHIMPNTCQVWWRGGEEAHAAGAVGAGPDGVGRGTRADRRAGRAGGAGVRLPAAAARRGISGRLWNTCAGPARPCQPASW